MPFGAPQVEEVELNNSGPPSSLASTIANMVAPTTSQAPPGLHPSISGMLSELPPPKSDWSKAEQADWLDALAGLFRVVYKSPGDAGAISVTYQA
jgi:hypothetical protein